MPRKGRKSNPLKNPKARPDAVKMLGDNISLKARFWIEKNDETFLASGRVDLLKKLAEYGSISQAAEVMGISYHHAWSMIDKMNELAEEPLVITYQGGKGGGGTELTPRCKYLLAKFDEIHNSFHNLVAEISLSSESDDS